MFTTEKRPRIANAALCTILVSYVIEISSFQSSAPLVQLPPRAATLPRLSPISVRITPDGSPTMQEYRKKVLAELTTERNDAELDGYQLFDMIVAKWSVPYGVDLRRMDFGGKKLLYLNVMWKYLGQSSFPLTERQYLEHLEYIARKLVQWGIATQFKKEMADCRKKPIAHFGYAVSFNLPISEPEIEAFVREARFADD